MSFRIHESIVRSQIKVTSWQIRTATVFADRQRALAFERHLKTGSGRSFLHRHL